MSNDSAPKDHTFRARFDAEDIKRLRFLEEQLGANGSEVLRRLIKEKHDVLHAVREEHRLLFFAMEEMIRHKFAPLTLPELRSPHFMTALKPLHQVFFPNAEFSRGLLPVLEDLVRWGYVREHNGRYMTGANRPEPNSNRPPPKLDQ